MTPRDGVGEEANQLFAHRRCAPTGVKHCGDALVSKTKEHSSILWTSAMPRTTVTEITIAADRAYRRKWYAKNADHAKARVTARREALKAWLRDHRATLQCVTCGEDDPDCLDFHHVDHAGKEASIGHAIHAGWSLKRMISEMAKCIVLCANCHRKHHGREAREARQTKVAA